ncbi:MAG: thiol peroxidase [Aquificaceae bacterium]|nr:thiol peroxidase [Aquificaceae bacterium]MDW8236784.1 thiol peroxidase [Aquificaceae bacterium]
MARQVNLKGNPVNLCGPELKEGDIAPQVTLVTKDLQEHIAGGSKEKVQVIVSVPSLDTPVCETETKKFNELIANLEGVELTVVSMDLPFAQKRFCESFNIDKIIISSDFRYRDMEKYGVLIAEGALKGILARAVFVISKEGKIHYQELVPEITQEPDYEQAMKKIKELT